MPEFSSPGGPLRVTLLRTFVENCQQAAKWQAERDHSNPRMALGTVFHAIAAECFATLSRPHVGERAGRDGWVAIPSEELMVIAREVYARPDIPVLPSKEFRELGILLRQFLQQKWPMNRFAYVEERLAVPILCPDGEFRILTGQPDVVFTDPPHGWSIIDHKTGYQKPPAPRNEEDPAEWEKDNGRPYLSSDGNGQLDNYGSMLLLKKPDAQYVTLEEHHWRWGLTRRATLYREELEHTLPKLGADLMNLEAVLAGQTDPEANSGAHCLTRCPRPQDCPIPPMERGEGAVVDAKDLAAYAEQFVVRKAQADDAAKKVKAALAAGYDDPVLPDGSLLGWVQGNGGGRSFKLHPPD